MPHPVWAQDRYSLRANDGLYLCQPGARGHSALRQALHDRGILTVGIPKTVEPMHQAPSPEAIHNILNEAGLHRQRTPHQVHLACACG